MKYAWRVVHDGNDATLSSRRLFYPLTFMLAPKGAIDGKRISLLYTLFALGEFSYGYTIFLNVLIECLKYTTLSLSCQGSAGTIF